MKVGKQTILRKIQQLAEENGGKPPGGKGFERTTGIRKSAWLGKFWVRWGDALREAGFQPNTLQRAYSETFLMECLIRVTRACGHFPSRAELQMSGRNDPALPSASPYFRLSQYKPQLIERLLRFCEGKPEYDDIRNICNAQGTKLTIAAARKAARRHVRGHVYLFRSGKLYKVGRTNNVKRRWQEMATQVPGELTMIHSIKTDDPEGIEKYWHLRFAERRAKREWFQLTAADVIAFKRRAFM